MVDVSDKGLECEDMNNNNNSMSCSKNKNGERCGSSSSSSTSSSDGGSCLIKTCVDCGTTKTPLWRGGPAGPKSLCNACGIRSRKRRRALLGITKEEKKQKKTTICTSDGDSQTSVLTSNNKSNYMGDLCLKKKLMAMSNKVVLQRPRSAITKPRRKICEVEQAALMLMALSYGSIYA
ncbi:GATA transcription factor 15-like [Rutidosis leptorrhynchoides]|uniref:GATA transcription factor 15-like n=1 Tax=Rutidosis leptorrhynchoides TaxID=125765 RepID=UPI003A998E65